MTGAPGTASYQYKYYASLKRLLREWPAIKEKLENSTNGKISVCVQYGLTARWPAITI